MNETWWHRVETETGTRRIQGNFIHLTVQRQDMCQEKPGACKVREHIPKLLRRHQFSQNHYWCLRIRTHGTTTFSLCISYIFPPIKLNFLGLNVCAPIILISEILTSSMMVGGDFVRWLGCVTMNGISAFATEAQGDPLPLSPWKGTARKQSL